MARSPFLRAVDALCEELQSSCGMTRFCLMIDRRPHPLTITFESQFHVRRRSGSAALIELELEDHGRRLGRVILEDSLAHAYPDDVRRAAAGVVTRHAAVLGALLPDLARVIA